MNTIDVNKLVSWLEDLWSKYCPSKWVAASMVALYAYYKFSTWHFGIFKKLGVKGPRPIPVFGTMLSMMREGFIHDVELKKYGNVVGYFQGRVPGMMIFDVDMLKDILVKDASYFQNRYVPFDTGYPLRYMLTALVDDHWKHVRSTLTPTFSTGKLRRMQKHIEKCAACLIKNLQEKADKNETFDFKDYCGAYTMDVIASTAFGIEIDSHNDPSNQFVQNSKEIFKFSLASPRVIILIFLPFLIKPLSKLGVKMFPKRPLNFFMSVVDRSVNERKTAADDEEKPTDFLQLMVNAYIDDSETDQVLVNEYTGTVLRWSHKGLTHAEIIAQGILFFLGGFESTANTLSFLAYYLAVNTDCQDKLIQEIDDVMRGQDAVTHDIVKKMPYLDMCFSEVLRLNPPAGRTNRVAGDDVTIKGVFIPKGMMVIIPIFALHMDPEIWPDPTKFNPDRFLPAEKASRNPYYYLPFGAGPRNCLAMRLAQLEMKMAAVHILQRFRFKVSEETEIPLKVHRITMRPVNGVRIRVEQRQPSQQ